MLKPALRFSSVFCGQQEAYQLASYSATIKPHHLHVENILEMISSLSPDGGTPLQEEFIIAVVIGLVPKKNATTLLFQSISYILLRLHNLYKYIEFLNASNYVFPTNHLVGVVGMSVAVAVTAGKKISTVVSILKAD